MAQRRMISKSISTSKKVNSLNDFAALLFTWLIPWTDDFGRMDGDILLIRAKVIPLRRASVHKIEQSLRSLEKLGLILRYKVQNSWYLQLVDFENHQTFKSDRPRRGEYPAPEREKSSTLDHIGNHMEPSVSEGKVSEDKKKRTHIGEFLKDRTGDNRQRS